MKFPKSLILMSLLIACGISGVYAGDGSLSVKTDPDGIEVWLDDKYLGDSPIMEKKLKPGRYSLKLVDAIQHTSQAEEVFIQPDQNTLIEKTLVSKFGGLRISTEPQGSEVYLLTDLGTTPLANNFMNPGKYRLLIKHPTSSYDTITQDILINKGETVNVAKTLVQKQILDTKAKVRLILGAGAVAGFVWAITQQQAETWSAENTKDGSTNGHSLYKWLGISGGLLCVAGFEVVAFF